MMSQSMKSAFFFSSRRRHTRFDCDWSSDVCSSDLDAGALYVFVRAFDPHPDSIITVLARRDYFTPSDMIWLFLDSYHDRRTGYEFGVNPSGVKLDAQIYNDGNEDFAWDAVW